MRHQELCCGRVANYGQLSGRATDWPLVINVEDPASRGLTINVNGVLLLSQKQYRASRDSNDMQEEQRTNKTKKAGQIKQEIKSK